MEAVKRAHATPARAYHGLDHVAEVLGHWQSVADGPGWAQPRETWLALLFHDAIHEPGRSDNEARSAQFARDCIGRWLGDRGLDAIRVAALIELTARHGQLVPADFDDDPHPEDARNLLDCDMAILGADARRFDAYDAAIAAEYRPVVPGWLFRIKRRAFLKGLLARERIYLGDFFHARLDAAARANLRRAVTGKR
ncbi:MAG: hypothetical protein Q4F49_05450 [Pseudoxanthomonas suwonensis]|nr:hypothetical protein [Pseudoxanthomonas suwonensis]